MKMKQYNVVAVKARNLKNGAEYELGQFSDYNVAMDAIMYDLEWDENDVIEDYQIEIWYEDNTYHVVDSMVYNPTVEEYDDCDYEVGYDPYMGCFSDDC